MEWLEKNEKALEKFGEKFFHLYQDAKNKGIPNCKIEEAANKEKVICRLQGQWKWRLNSMQAPEWAAQLYAERYAQIKDYSLVCIFGMSDGKAIRHLLANCNGTQTILIYEPDREIFCAAMQSFPLEDIFLQKNVELVVGGINGKKLEDKLFEMVTYQNHTLMVHCILPNYDMMYPAEAKAYMDAMLYYSKAEVFNKNTEVELASKFADNLLLNLPYLLNGSSVTRLVQIFSKLPLKKIPAVIVSAGPSLDKNIKELKKAEGKAFIIGVDSALKALVREGIRFDLAISVDPRKNPDVFSDERVNDYPYVLSGYSIPLIAGKNKNTLFFEAGYGFDAFEAIIRAKTGLRIKSVETGGSVATDALSLAIELGFSNVILVGQDLAFTDGKGHVSGFAKSKQEDWAHVKSRVLEPVEAYGGGTVMTDIQMHSYRQWFEQKIGQIKNKVTVYNATEGGARIHGAVEMPLAEAIRQLCTEELDFGEILAKVPPSFTKEQQWELAEEFSKSVSQVAMLQEKLQTGVDAYGRLIQMERSNLRIVPEYQQTLQEIYEMNHIEEMNGYMSLIRLYAKESEYEAAEDIYAAEDLSVQEIAERGKKMMEGYVAGCEICKVHLKEMLLPGLLVLIEKLQKQ